MNKWAICKRSETIFLQVGCRWVGELADFNLMIRYRPGRRIADAYGLSQLPLDVNKYMAQCTAEVK